MELALIDAIGPFFRGVDKRRINWSKIHFTRLAVDGPGCEAQWQRIREDMATFAQKVSAMGYNAVTLDDVMHLSDHTWFEAPIRERAAFLRGRFREIFAILREHGLAIYITTDFLTTSTEVDARLGNNLHAATSWFGEVIGGFLDDFPEVAGIILRIGESDGTDVHDALRSRLFLRTAREVNQMLRDLLPIFEKREHRLIFRTWTVGAYLVGDLIWHRGRLSEALDGIDSPAFVLSMKHGESDFFRFLPLNRHFFRNRLPKIIELQARREYEGAGEFPSFIGWDCEQYARELASAPNVIGFSVWCQTGGWHAFRRLAFLDSASVWIELNACAAIRIIKDGQSVEQAVTAFFGPERTAAALELLQRCDSTIRNLLYIPEFAGQKLFFRRVRIPPLLHVYWDSIFVNDPVRKVIAHFVHDPEAAVRDGEAAFANFDRMHELAGILKTGGDDLLFMRDTFAILLLVRRYYLLPHDPELEAEIKAAKKAYKKRWPRTKRQRYRIRISFGPSRLGRRTMKWLALLLIRRQRGYRQVLDRLFTLTTLSWIYRFFHVRHRRAMPKFLRKSAMGVDAVLR